MNRLNYHTLRIFAVLTLLALCFFASIDSAQGTDQNVSSPLKTEKVSITQLPESPFIRLVKDANGEEVSFDTSFVTFASEDGTVRVTLIGAIHIADTEYFKTLNQRFREFDALLYEMVGDDSPRPVSARESTDPIGGMQRFSAYLMNLDFQIGSIDYHAPNFVHADLTSAEFTEAQKKRQDGFAVWFLRSYGYEFARYHDEEETDTQISILEFLFSPNRCRTLRRLNAQELLDSNSEAVVEGKGGSSLITDRNEKALKILKEQIASGKKNLAIFYGAAHLPHFAENLEKEFKMKPVQIEWIPCWNLQ